MSSRAGSAVTELVNFLPRSDETEDETVTPSPSPSPELRTRSRSSTQPESGIKRLYVKKKILQYYSLRVSSKHFYSIFKL